MTLSSGEPGAVEGQLDHVEVQLRACYEAELKKDPAITGRVSLRLGLDAGTVSAVEVVSNNSGDEDLATCLVQEARRWRFREDTSGTVEQDWLFTSLGD